MRAVKRVAIVTGAAKPDSIGHAVARGLLEEGMQVVVADLYEEGFVTLPACTCIRTDASDARAVEAVGEERIVLKPFRNEDLARKIRTALGAGENGQVVTLRR